MTSSLSILQLGMTGGSMQSRLRVLTSSSEPMELNCLILLSKKQHAKIYEAIEAGDQEKIEVDYVEKKQVKKPGGGKPGFVVYYTNYSMVIDSNISQIRLCAD